MNNTQGESIWQDARDVLDDARQWRHHDPEGWAAIDRYLDQLETAATAFDAEAAFSPVTDLELMNPLRCRPSHNPNATGIPAETLDFLNHVDNLVKENLAEQK